MEHPNFRRLKYGGTHINAIVDAIYQKITEKNPITMEKLKNHMVLVVKTDASQTYYMNATHQSICNSFITDVADKLMQEGFSLDFEGGF